MLNIFKKQEGLLNVYRQMIFFGIYLLAFYSIVCYLGSTSLRYKNLEDCILSKAVDASLFKIAFKACNKEIESEFISLQDSHAMGYRYQDALNEGYTKIQIYESLSSASVPFFTFKSFGYGLNRINRYPESKLSNTIWGALIFGTIGWFIGIIFTYLSIIFKRKPDDLKDLPQ